MQESLIKSECDSLLLINLSSANQPTEKSENFEYEDLDTPSWFRKERLNSKHKLTKVSTFLED